MLRISAVLSFLVALTFPPLISAWDDAYSELHVTDLGVLATSNQPDWSLPDAFREKSHPTRVERPLTDLTTDYRLSAIYTAGREDWRVVAFRIVRTNDPEDREHEVLFNSVDNYKRINFESAFPPFSLRGQNYCTDNPGMHAPNDAGSNFGDQASYSWTNTMQQCEYEANYEFQAIGGSGTWVVVEFVFSFLGGNDDDDDGDQSQH